MDPLRQLLNDAVDERLQKATGTTVHLEDEQLDELADGLFSDIVRRVYGRWAAPPSRPELVEWAAALPSVASSGAHGPGVYFLFRCGDVTYVGRSNNCISRVRHHAKEKTFDKATFLAVERESLDRTESALIRLLSPSDNRQTPALDRAAWSVARRYVEKQK